MTIRITPNDKGHPPGKLAEAELHFSEGPLEGLKLIGFSIWERRGGGGRNVTFPARQYAVNGERRSFALLRPIIDSTAQGKVRELILDAFQNHEHFDRWRQATASGRSTRGLTDEENALLRFLESRVRWTLRSGGRGLLRQAGVRQHGHQ